MRIEGVWAARLFYGTAWREGGTARLTGLALGQGFSAIDTANQRNHYHEAEAGRRIREAPGIGSPSVQA